MFLQHTPMLFNIYNHFVAGSMMKYDIVKSDRSSDNAFNICLVHRI